MKMSQLAGKNLKRFLLEKHMTQADFADIIPTDVRTVNRWINNGIEKSSIIEELAILLGKDFFDFYQEI